MDALAYDNVELSLVESFSDDEEPANGYEKADIFELYPTIKVSSLVSKFETMKDVTPEKQDKTSPKKKKPTKSVVTKQVVVTPQAKAPEPLPKSSPAPRKLGLMAAWGLKRSKLSDIRKKRREANWKKLQEEQNNVKRVDNCQLDTRAETLPSQAPEENVLHVRSWTELHTGDSEEYNSYEQTYDDSHEEGSLDPTSSTSSSGDTLMLPFSWSQVHPQETGGQERNQVNTRQAFEDSAPSTSPSPETERVWSTDSKKQRKLEHINKIKNQRNMDNINKIMSACRDWDDRFTKKELIQEAPAPTPTPQKKALPKVDLSFLESSNTDYDDSQAPNLSDLSISISGVSVSSSESQSEESRSGENDLCFALLDVCLTPDHGCDYY